MSKRRHSRFIRRLETEFSAEGQNYRAISSDFSLSGLFIRTNHPFPPGTRLDIRIHLPDGNTAVLRGEVRRALNTKVTSLKNGMGIELTEKDALYDKFMLSFTGEAGGPAPGLTTSTGTPPGPEDTVKPAAAEPVIIACAACGVKNKVRTGRLSQGPKCGKCGSPLSAS